MRKHLEKKENIRSTFTGTFSRYGTKTNYKGYPERTILLKDVMDWNGKIVSDHLWFNDTKGFQKLGDLEEGDIIQFDAGVKGYVKGFVNHRHGIDEREWDYRLSHPTRMMRLKE